MALAVWPVNAQLEMTDGSRVMLASFRGKPAILFYEDKDSTKLNKPLKDALFTEGRQRNLLNAVHVIAVANLKGFDWFPAKQFALDGVRKAEKEAGVPVYMDFDGALSKSGPRLPERSSTIILLDKFGRVAWRHTGALDATEARNVLDQLVALIAP